jgi:hypothetical protein
MFAIDFDGTVADTNAAKAALAFDLHGVRVRPAAANRSGLVPIVGQRAYAAIRRTTRTRECTASLPLMKGAARGLEVLATMGPIFILTARPLKSVDGVWDFFRLNDLLGQITDVVSTHRRRKLTVAAGLGCTFLIDDDPRHLARTHRDSVLGVHFAPDGSRPNSVAGWAELLAWLNETISP